MNHRYRILFSINIFFRKDPELDTRIGHCFEQHRKSEKPYSDNGAGAAPFHDSGIGCACGEHGQQRKADKCQRHALLTDRRLPALF